MVTDPTLESLQQQLEALYAEREWLNNQLGTVDAESVVTMLQSLEAQLADMYKRFGSTTSAELANAGSLLAQIEELASKLDEKYSQKSVVFEINDNKPVLKAVWTEHLDGDN
jgi:hypothetical protein